MTKEIISTMIRMNLVGMYGILLVLAIRLLLKKISHQYVYVLWIIAFCILILPFGIIGGFSLVPGAIARPYMSASDNWENKTGSENDMSNMDSTYQENKPAQDVVKENVPVFDGNMDGNYYPGNAENTDYRETGKVTGVICIIYSLGVVTLMLLEALRYIRLYQYIRRQEIIEKDSARRIVVLRRLETPFVFGFIKPTIYLSDNMTEEERSYILAHEQYHCKRKDTIIKPFIMLITFAYWYNPIVWLGYHFFSIDMELSCDEAVIEKLSGTIKKDYAASLLKYGALQSRYVISVMTFGKPNLKSRICNVLNYKRRNLFFSAMAIAIVVLVAVGLVCRPAGDKDNAYESKTSYADEPKNIYGVNSEEAAEEDGTEKTVFEDFDQNGIAEYAVTSINTNDPDYDGRLQFFWNDKCVYDYNAILRVFVSEAGYVDLDGDEEKEIYIIFNSFVNSMPLQEYIVLKQKGEVWEPLEMYHGETMLDNEFPITIKGGGGKTVVMSCEGTEQTVSYELENYWAGILRQIEEESGDADYSYVEALVEQDKENFKEGEPYGSILSWGIWEVKQGSFEERACLIASHGIGGIDIKFYPLGILDVWFNYDSDGNIQILNLTFHPEYQSEELVYMLEGAEERERAVRYQGERYSILIPENDWEYENGFIDEKKMDLWKYLPGEDIQLCVISLGDMQKEEAEEWVIKQYEEYHLESNEFGELSGAAAWGEKLLDIRIFQFNGTYAVARFYPLEAAEGAGMRMRVMTNSFVFEAIPEMPVSIHVFAPEDVIVTPEIKEYDFAAAQETGTLKTVQGMLPGAAEGTWYIVEIDGIEYYYGKYDDFEEITLWGYSVISRQYSLKNGLSIEMTKEEVLSEYPDMAIVEFEEDKTLNGVIGHSGWNGVCYPRSYIGMDNEWEYAGKDYLWTDQFDYAMIADIDLGEEDTLPKYIALLMKNDAVAAITFYYPTAG